MPESVETNLEDIQKQAVAKVKTYVNSQTADVRTSIEPVAFGLKSLSITFADDEKHADTEKIENLLKTIPHVQSVENTEYKRAIG